MDPRVAPGAAVRVGLLPPGRRGQGAVRGRAGPVHVLRRPQVRADTLQSRPALGSR